VNNKEIIVKIYDYEFENICANDGIPYADLMEAQIISKLRHVGVPIKGVLLFQGIKEGTLEVYYDCVEMATIYKWRP